MQCVNLVDGIRKLLDWPDKLEVKTLNGMNHAVAVKTCLFGLDISDPFFNVLPFLWFAL